MVDDALAALSREELLGVIRRQQQELAAREAAIERRDEKIRELEWELAPFRRPVNTPENSSVPPSRGQQANRVGGRRRKLEPRRGHVGVGGRLVFDRYIAPKTEAARLRQRHRTHRDSLYVFPDRDDVEPTNNGSERDLRPSVIHRKVICGFRSAWAPKGRNLLNAFRAVAGPHLVTLSRLARSPFLGSDSCSCGEPILPDPAVLALAPERAGGVGWLTLCQSSSESLSRRPTLVSGCRSRTPLAICQSASARSIVRLTRASSGAAAARMVVLRSSCP